MSENPDESGEKSHDPTQKKLEDARRKGEFPKSADLTTAAAYGGLLMVLIAFGSTSMATVGSSLADLIGRSDSLSLVWFADGGTPLTLDLIGVLSGPVAIWLGLPALAALLAIVSQRAIVLAPEKLKPKLNRISILSNAKNKFGRGGLFEFAKSAVKLTIYSALLGIYLYRQLPQIVTAAQLSTASALATLGQLAIGFLAIVLAIAASIGFVDLLWQHQEHIRKHRMSRKELTDETKQTEGDPHMKQQRRQRAMDIAMNRMLRDVPGADVVLVNPEHYAVALTWNRKPGSAPVCVAKGIDEIAARIREIAAEAAVPIHRDPDTARALYATVELGEEVQPEHYQAVAAAIRFAEAMRARARRGLG
ncbi:flagellar biosynthesis protein FlhB [Pseudoruegeria sp. HB172150]|uniref:EscU/YscU/HrcU family type III secretion system export apparatus switch protein n=1 Tax=Pseudoruegeria sp. HB172150 TaxID=2721164 RepID=UPI001554B66A|nr:flagellar type III secretion system protein FlhB [Pseudoruegeria sp. HB172150]